MHRISKRARRTSSKKCLAARRSLAARKRDKHSAICEHQNTPNVYPNLSFHSKNWMEKHVVPPSPMHGTWNKQAFVNALRKFPSQNACASVLSSLLDSIKALLLLAWSFAGATINQMPTSYALSGICFNLVFLCFSSAAGHARHSFLCVVSGYGSTTFDRCAHHT